MEGYYYNPMKMKRKDLEEVNDDFSDFSLSSPARKIRRLDAGLAPIIEEEEMEILMVEQVGPEHSFESNVAAVGGGGAGRGVVMEELPSEPEIKERAIVLFKPMDSPLVPSPSNFSVTVNPQLISGIKYQVLWPNQSHPFRQLDDEAIERDNSSGATDNFMAVVPWVPSQLPSGEKAGVPSQTERFDTTDAEQMETATMDVEDIYVEQSPANEAGGKNSNEGLHQWQQNYCMVPQPPQNISTPVVWYQ